MTSFAFALLDMSANADLPNWFRVGVAKIADGLLIVAGRGDIVFTGE